MTPILRCFCLLLVAGLLAFSQSMPKLASVDPPQGKAGDEITTTGENLERKSVVELFLTDGKTDLKVSIVAQTATTIKFKIPAEAKPGRFSLMIMTAGADPKLIEQPVRLTVQ